MNLLNRAESKRITKHHLKRRGVAVDGRMRGKVSRWVRICLEQMLATVCPRRHHEGALGQRDWYVGNNTHTGAAVFLDKDRPTPHILLTGRDGATKSALKRSLMAQRMESGHGVMVITGGHGGLDFTQFCDMADLAGRREDVRMLQLGALETVHRYNLVAAGSVQSISNRLMNDLRQLTADWQQLETLAIQRWLVQAIAGLKSAEWAFNIGDIAAVLSSQSAQRVLLAQLNRCSADPRVIADMQGLMDRVRNNPAVRGRLNQVATHLLQLSGCFDSYRPDIDFGIAISDKQLIWVDIPLVDHREVNAKQVDRILKVMLDDFALAAQSAQYRPHVTDPFTLFFDSGSNSLSDALVRLVDQDGSANVVVVCDCRSLQPLYRDDLDLPRLFLAQFGTALVFQLQRAADYPFIQAELFHADLGGVPPFPELIATDLMAAAFYDEVLLLRRGRPVERVQVVQRESWCLPASRRNGRASDPALSQGTTGAHLAHHLKDPAGRIRDCAMISVSTWPTSVIADEFVTQQ